MLSRSETRATERLGIGVSIDAVANEVIRVVTTKTKSIPLAARVEAERKKIVALEEKIAKLQQRELERIGKLAESAGCLEETITDAEYKAAFDALVKEKKTTAAGNAPASSAATSTSTVHD